MSQREGDDFAVTSGETRSLTPESLRPWRHITAQQRGGEAAFNEGDGGSFCAMTPTWKVSVEMAKPGSLGRSPDHQGTATVAQTPCSEVGGAPWSPRTCIHEIKSHPQPPPFWRPCEAGGH